MSVLRSFVPTVEGFSSKPYWDFKQWSWGYGTKVPGSVANKNVVPTGTITRAQAFDEMMKDLTYRYNYLRPKMPGNLRPNQWAALTSFAYNEGIGAATNLIPNIKSGDLASLETQFKSYNKVTNAAGQKIVSSDLVDRRNKEWQLYIS